MVVIVHICSHTMLHVQVHNYSPCNSASYSMFCVCDSYRQMHFQTASQALEKEKINRV